MDDVLLTSELKGGRLRIAAGGSWTAAHARELEDLVDRVSADAAAVDNVSIDMKGVREFDTFGAWLLERLTRAWSAAGRKPEIVGLPPPV
jgi:phospholipid/cholesterol/gamma-HCH transport system permease protein